MEARDDERAIGRLLAEYGSRLDRADHAGWVELFAETGEFLVYGRSFAGHAQLRAMAEAAPGGLHLGAVPVIDVDGDGATVQQSFLFVDRVTREMRVGYYDDTLVRVDGAWRFATRRSTFLTPDGPSDRP